MAANCGEGCTVRDITAAGLRKQAVSAVGYRQAAPTAFTTSNFAGAHH